MAPYTSHFLAVASLLVLATGAQCWYVERQPAPSYYPGNKDGWNQVGWGDDGYYRYTFNNARGFWSSNSWGCGVWHCEEGCTSNQVCAPCHYFDGKDCATSNSPGCQWPNNYACAPCSYAVDGQCMMADGCGTEYCKNYNAFAGAWATANGAGAAARAGDASAFAGPGGTSASAGGNGIGIAIDSNGRVTTLKSGKAVIDGQTATVFYNAPGGGGTVVTSGPNSMAAASSSG